MLTPLISGLLLLPQAPQTAGDPPRPIVVGLPDPARARALVTRGEDGELDGFARRLMEEVAAEVGLEPAFALAGARELLDDLESGAVDVLGSISVSIERLDRAAFTMPILICAGATVVRAGEEHPRTVADLRRLRVGVAGAGIAQKFCIEQGIPCEAGSSLRIELARVAAGELDCVVTTQIAARFDLESWKIAGLSEQRFEHEALHLAYAFAVPAEEKDLLARLNYGLARTRDDGTWDELYEQWISPFQPHPRPRSRAPLVIGSLLLVSAASAFLVFLLRARLRHRTRELDESERRYLAVAESLPALVYSYHVGDDGQRERRFATSNLAEWRARFPELDPGGDYRAWIDAVHPEDRARYEATTARSRIEKIRFEVEFRLRAADGSFHWLHAIASPVPGAAGILWQGLLLDVTPLHEAREEHHRLELQLVQAQKMEGLGLLAGGIAHDFNNLLTGLRGNLELASGTGDAARRDLHLGEARQAAQRASELTHQLLAYAGQAQLVESVVALDEVVREMADLLGSTLHARARLELECGPEPVHVRGDATLIRQVVMNLLTNAVEAIPDERQGRIRVGIARRELLAGEPEEHVPVLVPGVFAVLEVEDDGRGMDEATRARIFDPFFTTKFAGRGLGLSVLQRTLERHGGAWHVRSAPGAGTCFRILLPAVPAPPLELRAHELVPMPRRALRILVVDDDPRVLSVACALLEARGHAVAGAPGETRALELVASFRPDGVLLDLTMPGRGGLELLPLLRAGRPTLPVVLMSGYSERDIARAGVHVNGFLAKPFSGEDLARVLEGALAAAEA